MKLERLQAMPDWPARMTADVASLFMCLSESAFLSRYGTAGFTEGTNRFWARAWLEREVARQAGIGPIAAAASDRDTSWDDLA